jgi:hypothetical protein
MIIHKVVSSLSGILLLAVLASSARAQLQPNAQQAGLQSGGSALRMGRYDKAAEVVDSGTITSIGAQKTGSLPRGTYVSLRAGAVTLNVQMGLYAPANIPFAVGDQVQVTGSLMSVNGQQIVLARQVQSSSKTLTVRSAHGFVLRPRPVSQGAQP